MRSEGRKRRERMIAVIILAVVAVVTLVVTFARNDRRRWDSGSSSGSDAVGLGLDVVDVIVDVLSD